MTAETAFRPLASCLQKGEMFPRTSHPQCEGTVTNKVANDDFRYSRVFSAAFFERARWFYRTYGFKALLKRAAVRLLKLNPVEREVLRYSKLGNKAVFSRIYEQNLWADSESRSGHGSTYEFTGALRNELPEILERLAVRTFIDAPCGDFNWMRHVKLPPDCKYIGIDVVPQIVATNQVKFGDTEHQFLCRDITSERVPFGDLIFCRDCLFHLSYADIRGFLVNFIESNSRYLMTTTHKNPDGFPNKDISSGAFRRIDLFRAPFNFGKAVVYRVEDHNPMGPEREMCVWMREDVAKVVENFGA